MLSGFQAQGHAHQVKDLFIPRPAASFDLSWLCADTEDLWTSKMSSIVPELCTCQQLHDKPRGHDWADSQFHARSAVAGHNHTRPCTATCQLLVNILLRVEQVLFNRLNATFEHLADKVSSSTARVQLASQGYAKPLQRIQPG